MTLKQQQAQKAYKKTLTPSEALVKALNLAIEGCREKSGWKVRKVVKHLLLSMQDKHEDKTVEKCLCTIVDIYAYSIACTFREEFDKAEHALEGVKRFYQ